VEAEVLAFDSLDALEAAPPGSLAGKIVFIDEPMARSRDGSGYGVAVRKRLDTASVAKQGGAVAALIRSVGTSSHRFAHTGTMRPGNSDPDDGVPTAALAAPDADQLARVLAYGKPVVVKLVLTPRTLPPAPSGNVIAEFVGREAPQEIVLVGAHLDSWDLGTGAVDDGAGVAIVVAAVNLLMEQLPQPPRRTIRVVLFGSEEVGYVGAKAYAEGADLANHVIAAESDFGAGDIWRFDTRIGEARLPARCWRRWVSRPATTRRPEGRTCITCGRRAFPSRACCRMARTTSTCTTRRTIRWTRSRRTPSTRTWRPTPRCCISWRSRRWIFASVVAALRGDDEVGRERI
jgi:hypothetical protein